ncbi:MAG TPA: DUF4430 domain-containing protein [Solirubrobacteraceae bacterium]|nr:DUF4430 domain-containing protein [Solirubrobacteraceae bacterium]
MRRALAALACAAAAVSGCGLGAGDASTDRGVSVVVSSGFGTDQLKAIEAERVREDETVMRLLQREFDVTTRFGGGFVQSIEGLAGGSRGGRRFDWFYYVNGIEASEGAASREIAPGDRIWWDHHDWSTAPRIPAVVGAFPEPFVSGSEGERRPVRIDCAPQSERECDEVARRLVAAGVRATPRSALGTSAGIEILRVLVGPWEEVRRDPTAAVIGKGPQHSGVFARPHAGGIDLLDPEGKVVRTLTDAGGLVAATRFEEQQPTWVVTGTDAAGVAAAASALDEGVLMNRFALAVEEGRGVPLPVQPQAPPQEPSQQP